MRCTSRSERRVRSRLTGRDRTRCAGSVTAETAVVLPALVLLLAVLLAAVSVGIAQLRCVDAAREAARAASRGDSDAAVRRLAERTAPAGAAVDVTAAAGDVTVTVSARPRLLVVAGLRLPALTVRARAVAAREPGAASR